MMLQIFRWYKYGIGDLGIGLLFIIQALLLFTLYLVIKGVNTIVQSLKNISQKLPTMRSMLDVGADGDILSYKLMLEPAIVTASVLEYNLHNKIYFKIYYAVPFYNYKVSIDIWFLDEQGKSIANSLEVNNEIVRGYREIKSIDQGTMDLFILNLPDHATDFIIRRIRYVSSAKP